MRSFGGRPAALAALVPAFVAFAGVSFEARAQEAPGGEASKPGKRTLAHEHQAAIGLMPGLGYRVIFPYDERKACGDHTGLDSRRVCTNTLPLFLDVQAAFGVSRRLDVITDVRLGLVADFTRNRQIAIAPGIRYWVDPERRLKLYATAQVVWDGTDQNGQVAQDDFAIRNANGLQFDVMPNLGLFVQFGETFGLRRWLRFELDAGLGVQARFGGGSSVR